MIMIMIKSYIILLKESHRIKQSDVAKTTGGSSFKKSFYGQIVRSDNG